MDMLLWSVGWGVAMGLRQNSKAVLIGTILIASLACLQPGIDPVFLTLLSAAHAVEPSAHGWIVGATQAGMAVGSLLVWRAGAHLSRWIFLLAALATLAAGLMTAQAAALPALLLVRATYGLGMGMIYTRAMSAAAADRPNGAYGAVFLVQLLLSTIVALALPPVATAASAPLALAILAAAPLLALLLLLAVGAPSGQDRQAAEEPSPERGHTVDMPAWALAAASLAFISATMMIWSFTGALAVAAGIAQHVIGWAVAIGSIAGALTALGMMREKLLVPLPLTGICAGLSLLAPIPGAVSGDDGLFILSVVLLNIGSTAIIIRTSGMASARNPDPVFRRFVACTHPLGMIIGPVAGSCLAGAFGEDGLIGGAMTAIATGCAALLLAAYWQRFADARTITVGEVPEPAA